MGVYLSKPKTEKVSENGGSIKTTRYGLSSMQGWRKSMEDAHIAHTEVETPGVALFGVFDGHGGPAVSRWISNHFADEFERNFAAVRQKVRTAEVTFDLEVPCSHEQATLNPPRPVPRTKKEPSLLSFGGGVGLSVDSSDEEEDVREEEHLIIVEDVEEKVNPTEMEEITVLVCEALQRTFMTLDQKMQTPESRADLKIIHENQLKADDDEGSEGPQPDYQKLIQMYLGGQNGVTVTEDGRKVFQYLPGDEEEDGEYAAADTDDDEDSDAPAGGAYSDDDNAEAKTDHLHPQVEDVDEIEQNCEANVTADPAASTKKGEDEVETEVAVTNADMSSFDATMVEPEADKEQVRSTEENDSDLPKADAAPVSSRAASKQKKPKYVKNVAETAEEEMKDQHEGGEETEVKEEPSIIKADEDTIDKPEDEDSERILPKQQMPYEPEHCGATAVVTAVLSGENPMLVVANAGDSRIVLARNGVAIPLSKDHKPNLSRETGRILAAGGRVTNGRVDGNLNLSRSVGDLAYKQDDTIPKEAQKITSFPDVRVIPLLPKDDFAIIACDGIWDCLGNQQLVDIIQERLKQASCEDENGTSARQPTTLSTICEEICDRCLAKHPLINEGIGCDNMTIMILEFGDELKGTSQLKDEEQGPRMYSGRLYQKV